MVQIRWISPSSAYAVCVKDIARYGSVTTSFCPKPDLHVVTTRAAAGRGFSGGGRLWVEIGRNETKRGTIDTLFQRLPLSRFFGDFLVDTRKLPAGGRTSQVIHHARDENVGNYNVETACTRLPRPQAASQ